MLGIGGDPVWEMLRWIPDFAVLLAVFCFYLLLFNSVLAL